MNLKKIKRTISASVLISVCMLTGCAGSVKDSSTVEISGSVDYSVYEAYGLIYDENSDCYTYNGSIVRFFNDPAAGAGFTNFFTGTVDIEEKYDADNNLVGIEECPQEIYDSHTQKIERFQSMSIGTQSDAAGEFATEEN